MNSYVKAPEERLDYDVDWSAWLEVGETIASKTVTSTVVGGTDVTIESSSIVGSRVVAWISGGTLGAQSTVAFSMTTSAGRQSRREITIVVARR